MIGYLVTHRRHQRKPGGAWEDHGEHTTLLVDFHPLAWASLPPGIYSSAGYYDEVLRWQEFEATPALLKAISDGNVLSPPESIEDAIESAQRGIADETHEQRVRDLDVRRLEMLREYAAGSGHRFRAWHEKEPRDSHYLTAPDPESAMRQAADMYGWPLLDIGCEMVPDG